MAGSRKVCSCSLSRHITFCWLGSVHCWWRHLSGLCKCEGIHLSVTQSEVCVNRICLPLDICENGVNKRISQTKKVLFDDYAKKLRLEKNFQWTFADLAILIEVSLQVSSKIKTLPKQQQRYDCIESYQISH